MVSAKLLEITIKHITDAKTLIDFLDENGFEIESAFWYIGRIDAWRLVIVSDELRSYTTLRNQMNKLDITIDLYDIILTNENYDDCYMTEKIIIK